jgi:hypothetical protein
VQIGDLSQDENLLVCAEPVLENGNVIARSPSDLWIFAPKLTQKSRFMGILAAKAARSLQGKKRAKRTFFWLNGLKPDKLLD